MPMSRLASLPRAALFGAWLYLSVRSEAPPCIGSQCGPASTADADDVGLLQHRRGDAAAALETSVASEGGRCCYGACPTSGPGSCNGPDHWCSQSEAICEQHCDSSATGGTKAMYCSLEPQPPTGRCCYGVSACPDAPVSADVPGCNPVEHWCSQSADLCENTCDSSAVGGTKAMFCPLPSVHTCTGIPDANPMELAVLSGDVSASTSVIPAVLAELGWSRGPRAVDPANLPGEFDIAQVYFKGCDGDRCDYCAVAFSATDDHTDVVQANNVTPVEFCGAPNVRGGYVQEMRGFYADPNFTMVREALTAQGCCRVYTTGHSLGGALAQLFAFCANQRGSRGSQDESGFAGLSDNVSLVTFGAVRLSEEPLYNGVPGRCFDGVRYSIAEAAPPPPTLETQLLAINLFVDTLLAMNDTTRASNLDATAVTISAALDNGQSAQAEQMLQQAFAGLYTFMLQTGGAILTQAPLPWVPAVASMWFAFALTHRDELQFAYDVVPGLFGHLKFPDVAYGPLQHPESNVPAPPMPRPETCNSTAPDVPQYNQLQLSFGMLGSISEGLGWFPNHALCCYIRALSDLPALAGCGERYFNNSASCKAPGWR